MPGEGDRVVVRMYRGVLGDCFLLTVWQGGTPKVALIDCGVLQRVRSGTELLARLPDAVIDSVGRDRLEKVEATWEAIHSIGDDIKGYLADKGGKLDLVVITHDHYDHVAGFTLPDEENVFLKDIAIEQLWLSWVENPNDPQSRALAARFSKSKEAVALAAEVGRHAAGELSDALEQVQALAGFIGPVVHPGLPAVTDKTKTTTQAIQAMREKVGASTRFLEPGQVIPAGESIGLKTYVLAPPRSERRLFKDSPTGTGEAREVYLKELDEATAVAAVALSQLHGMAVAGKGALEESQRRAVRTDKLLDPLPFARPHERPYPPKEGEKVERKTPGWQELRDAYEDEANAYRSLSADWTEAADTLALKLDSDTNNTSLVLAFELPGERILLFPGDAQVGNWESWGDQLYPAKPVDGEVQLAIEDILKRVVFYKVGHHASHNATARDRGLELMTDPRLCAAIPVVEAVAKIQGPGRKTPGKGWKMPFDILYSRLSEKTGGSGDPADERFGRERVVQGDGDPARESAAFATVDVGVSISHENAATGGRWVELTFPL